MSLLGIHVLSDDRYNAMKAAFDASAKGVVSDLSKVGANEVTKLVQVARDAFPALTEAFHQGFVDMHDSNLSGFAKMEKVVLDIMQRLPSLVPELTTLPNQKSFLLQLGQTLFNDMFLGLEDAAKELLKNLI